MKRRESRGLAIGPGWRRATRHALRSAPPPLAIEEARLSALHCGDFLPWGRACVFSARPVCRETVQRCSSHTGLSARGAGSRRAPEAPASEAGFAGTASCSTCGTTGRRPSSSRMGGIYIHMECSSSPKCGKNVAGIGAVQSPVLCVEAPGRVPAMRALPVHSGEGGRKRPQ